MTAAERTLCEAADRIRAYRGRLAQTLREVRKLRRERDAWHRHYIAAQQARQRGDSLPSIEPFNPPAANRAPQLPDPLSTAPAAEAAKGKHLARDLAAT